MLSSISPIELGPASPSGRVLTAKLGKSGSVGKGISGDRAIYSAIFELLEHVCYDQLLPDQQQLVPVTPRNLFHRGAFARDVASLSIIQTDVPTVPSRRYSPIDSSVEVWVPDAVAVAKGQPHSDLNRFPFYFMSSTGWAAGVSLRDALAHALLEVIERDAISALAMSCAEEHPIGHQLIQTQSSASAAIHGLVEDAVDSPIEVRMIPALAGFCAVALCKSRDIHGRVVIGSGASMNPTEAVERALCELEQEVYVNSINASFEGDSPYLGKNYLDSYPFLKRASTMEALSSPVMSPVETRKLIDLQRSATTCGDSGDTVRSICEDLGDLTPLYRVVWDHPSETTVVHALIPGAERFHMIRHGLPIEPISHLRSDRRLELCRARRE